MLVNGARIDSNGPGQTLENTTDPQGFCDSDSPGTYLPSLAPTDVLEIYARNIFGVTRVTVSAHLRRAEQHPARVAAEGVAIDTSLALQVKCAGKLVLRTHECGRHGHDHTA